MNIDPRSRRKLLCACSLALFLPACGPQPPQPGTPAFNWEAARTAYNSGDYVKAGDLLSDLGKKDNEFTARAHPWALVMSIGTANAYYELADKWEEGAKVTKGNLLLFRRPIGAYKSKAIAAGMQLAEGARRFIDANKDKEITFAFDLPESNLEDPVQYSRITKGSLVSEADAATMERAVLRKEILKQACIALKAPKDPPKARTAFQNGEAKVDAQAYMYMLGKGTYDVAQMFGVKKLNQPARVLIALYDASTAALAIAKDNKDAKILAGLAAEARGKLKEE